MGKNSTIETAKQAKEIANSFLENNLSDMKDITYGLPEIIDRYKIWKVPVLYKKSVIGDLCFKISNGELNKARSSKIDVLYSRMRKINNGEIKSKQKITNKGKTEKYIISELENSVIKGKAQDVLTKLPDQSVDMIFTSPPYYNARREYSEYDTYNDYLDLIRSVIKECKRVLMDGKFFIMNSSHVLVPRASRNESSSRISVPFDIHQIFLEEGFEFVDDIIWQKPEGAGWASGRGRRFSADRNAMQYKAVPVTEYVMVYRKKPCKLIDYFIRNHPSKEIINESKIVGEYDKTNIWYISPAHDKIHPAVFPLELAERVVRYYSFVNDVILDPFAGVGTTALASINLNRRFVMIECNDKYINSMKKKIDEKTNNLFSNINYKYIDYSDIVIKKDQEEYNVFQLISLLKKDGFTEKDIYNYLKKMRSKK